MSTKGNTKFCSDLKQNGAARKDSTEQLNTGSSLLNFMNLASGNVKTALEKPANFKRNINHRRYLQKQLRNFTKRNGDREGAPVPTKKKVKSQNASGEKNGFKSQNIAYMKNLANGWRQELNMKSSYMDKERNALKERNAVQQSFWAEPALCGGNLSADYNSLYNSYQFQYDARAEHQTADTSTAALETLINESWSEYEQTVPSYDCVPVMTSEYVGGGSEDFMTGEELTRNLDIKDLYVPELYAADKLLTDVQETLQYNGQISPSQYFLPSPSPYSTNDQNYFNFAINEHDAQGLPPIAMAFLNPGSLTHY